MSSIHGRNEAQMGGTNSIDEISIGVAQSLQDVQLGKQFNPSKTMTLVKHDQP